MQWTVAFQNMFPLPVPLVEKILRPVLVYTFLVIGLRVAGKRELAQLNPFDLIVLLMLSNTVQNAIIGNDNSLTGGLIGAVTLLAVNYVVVRIIYDHPTLDQLLEGSPDDLIVDGKVQMDRLHKELLTLPELESAAHKQGIPSLEEVERAVLEPTGTISFFVRKPTTESTRHEELLARLDELRREIASLSATTARV